MTEIDLADGAYTAVVDTVEDGLATVFFERDGDDVGNAVLDADRLPRGGMRMRSWTYGSRTDRSRPRPTIPNGLRPGPTPPKTGSTGCLNGRQKTTRVIRHFTGAASDDVEFTAGAELAKSVN